ncbi:uncharacterized protein [Melanerpes formicivorus]|uniref:uncharacterized protein isoform X2 n=1 Tax=Melanerpes formicivorus TaxID=211600 RepID=UPI00358EF239
MNFNYFPPENGISRNRRWRDFAHGKDYTKADSQSAVRGGPHAAEDECVLKRAVVHGEILQEQVFWPDSLTSVPSKMMEQIVLEVLLRQNNNEELGDREEKRREEKRREEKRREEKRREEKRREEKRREEKRREEKRRDETRREEKRREEKRREEKRREEKRREEKRREETRRDETRPCWKRTLRSSSPTHHPTPSNQLNHGTKCSIRSLLKHLQQWRHHHLPGQPIPMANDSLSEELLPKIHPKAPLVQIETVSPCSGDGCLGEETNPHLATTSLQRNYTAPSLHLAQPEIVSSCSVGGCLGEETNPLLATTSLQLLLPGGQ